MDDPLVDLPDEASEDEAHAETPKTAITTIPATANTGVRPVRITAATSVSTVSLYPKP
jgi:hypothetical protein